MATYKSSKDFKKGKATVTLNDEIYIGKFYYIVGEESLSLGIGVAEDDSIFEFLGIENKAEFCRIHYGYMSSWNYGMPHYRKGDYKAATKLTVAFMMIHEMNLFFDKIFHYLKFWKLFKKKKKK